MIKKYIEYSTNKFLSNGIRENEYIVHHYINFIPATTIDCNPPYITGKLDGKWLKYRKGFKPNPCNKSECEKYIGMGLLPLN